MSYLTDSANRLYYEHHQKANKQTIILISGLGEDHSYWLPIKDLFLQEYGVLLIDNRGTGKSTDVAPVETIATMANDVVAVMDACGLKNAHILGHSMGGFIAQTIARDFPHRVDKLMLCSTGCHPSEKIMHSLDAQNRLIRLGTVPAELLINLGLPWAYSNQLFAHPEKLKAVIQEKLDKPLITTQEVVDQHTNACGQFDSRPWLSNITAKTLILCGREDLLLPVDQNEFMAQSIQSSELVIIDDTAHLLHVEQPERFYKLIRKFDSSAV
ncbi:MAG: alpha/beta hydrolase [Pseudomonadota bacterium]